LGDKLEKEQGDEDVKHLNKMIGWSNLFGIVGLLAMGFGINLVAIIGLSTCTFSRWTMIAHHTCHGGYDRCHPNKNRWHRFKFGLGSLWRRCMDWFDWMLPEAWNVEHNTRHHYNLSENEDPDVVENVSSWLRGWNVPMPIKYVYIAAQVLTWKWSYYAPNTYKELKLAQWRREGRQIPQGVDPAQHVSILESTVFFTKSELFMNVLGPYFLIRFFIMPLPLLFIGQYFGVPNMYWSAVKNLFLADMLTNLHGFIAVVPNHAGDDMYRFRKGCRPFSGSFYVRQCIASVDFAYGSDSVDFFHGWLNYQIEHHMWPSLSMRSYQKAAPLAREICERHGVPYIKQSVWKRVLKTFDIMVGNTSMKWFPEQYEDQFLEIDKTIEAARKKTTKKTE